MEFTRIIEYADGTTELVDEFELFRIAESFASAYGIGGCKTLSEFIKNINEEDPSVLHGFVRANKVNNNISDYKRHIPKNNINAINPPVKQNIKSEDEIEKIPVNDIGNMKRFLKFWGAPKEKIEEATKKIQSGEIKVSKNDYSYITGDTLCDPNFNFEATLKKMDEDRKNSISFNVGMDTIGRKKQSG